MRVDLVHAHGSPNLYLYMHKGCRCTCCRAANTEFQRRYRAANADKIRAYKRRYQAEHPESYLACGRNRDARKMNTPGRHTAADIAAQLHRQRGKCYWQATDECKARRGNLGYKYHVDHVVPLFLGGSNGPENLVIACPSCNMSKGSLHPMDFAGVLA